MLRSYIVNVSRVETSPSADRPRGVTVPVCGVAASMARKGSIAEFEFGRGSCAALAAIHRRESRRNENDGSFRGSCHREQNLLGHPDRAVSRLFRHRGFRQKFRPEILDGDTTEIGHNPASPLEGAILSLASDSQVHSGYLQFGQKESLGVSLRARQLSLRSFQGLRVDLCLVAALKIKSRISGRCYSLDAPIDTNGRGYGRECFGIPADDKRCVPMALRVAPNNAGPWLTGEFSTPRDRDGNTASETKPTSLDSEPFHGVPQRRQREFAALEPKTCPDFQGGTGDRPSPYDLRLNDPRAVSKPVVFGPPNRETFRHPAPRWRDVRFFTRRVPERNALVPNPASAIPLHLKSGLCNHTGPQAVIIPHDGLIAVHDRLRMSLNSPMAPVSPTPDKSQYKPAGSARSHRSPD